MLPRTAYDVAKACKISACVWLVGHAPRCRCCAQFPEEDNVLVLGDSNLDDALEPYPTLLVEFYAPVSCRRRLEPNFGWGLWEHGASRRVAGVRPSLTQWCGHCKKLAPVWDQAAEELHRRIVFGKVRSQWRCVGRSQSV